MGVCALSLVSAAPRHSWLGCWGVCVFVCPLRLFPATPGWGVSCVCVCVWARVSAAPRHSWLGCWGVCVFVCPLRLYPATPGWGVGVCVCVLGLRFRLRQPLLAGVLGCVCVCVPAPLVPPHYWLGFVVCGLAVARHLFLCRGSLRVVRAARVCGTRWRLLLGTCPCAVVVAGGLPLWRALWPHFGVPRLVRSGRSRCSGGLSRRRGAFSHPGGLPPRIYWAAPRGMWRPAENRALCACRWPPPRQGLWARSTPYPFGAPRWGCPWRVPPASVLGCVRCGVWPVWTRSLTRPVSRTTHLSTGVRPVHRGSFVWTPTPPLSGRRTPRPGPAPVCVCVLCLAGSGGPPSRARSGAPHLFLVTALSFFFVRPLPGLGRPVCCGVFFFLFFFFSRLCAPVVSGVPCFLARGALGLGVLFAPPPFFSFFLFFSPPSGLVFLLLLGCVLFVAFFFVLFFFPLLCLLFFFFSLPCLFVFVPVLRCGVGLCVCGCGVCWCVVLLALRSVVGCVFCLVLCGVLVLGWAGTPCCPARCCAGSSWAVFVVLCCCVLLCSLLVFFLRCSVRFRGGPCCFVCVVLRLAVWHGPVALFLCWLLLRCAVWCSAVPWCLSWFCAVLFVLLRCLGRVLPRPLLWRVVVLCLSLGVVLCRPAVLLVVHVLSFLVPCFRAPPFSWRLLCGAVLVCRYRCSLCGALSPLWRWVVLCVVACCARVFAVGLGCPLLFPGGSRCRVSVVLSLSGRVARRPVVWCGVSWRSGPLCCVLW